MHLNRTRFWAIAAVLAAIVAALITPTAQAAPGCRVTYTVTSQWQSGYGASVSVTNCRTASGRSLTSAPCTAT